MTDALTKALAHIAQVKRLKKIKANRRAARVARRSGPDFGKYRDDLVGFARDICGIELWSRQGEVARALVEHDHVVVKSGHKVGKTRLVAVAVWWWCCTRVIGQAYITSASWLQVRESLWPEVRRVWQLALERGYRLSPDEPALSPDTGMHWPDGRKIVCFSTNSPERAAGFSGAELFFALDEASGIERAIFEAILGNQAGGAKELLTGNPTEASGVLYEAFSDNRHLYSTHTISSAETPNASNPDPSTWLPGLAGRAWIDRMIEQHGADSPFCDVRVYGNFPTQARNAVIGLAVIEAAQARHKLPETPSGMAPKYHRLRVGVDVARYGDDDSTIHMVRGMRTVQIHGVHGHNTQQVAGLVRALVREETERYCRERSIRGETERPLIKVDGIGVGAGVVDALRTGTSPGDVVDVNVAENANDDEMYARRRDEAWFAARDWLVAGGTLPEDGKLAGELAAPTYKFDPRGRYVVESKDEIKERIKRSPDKADALCLAVYEPAHQVAKSFRIKGL